jgi:CRISPR/Cas system-associated protein Cas10 (large subunit of type III CRISPR-Cas system)
MIFIHLDGDDIGSVLELLLLDDGVERARAYSASVTRALELVRDALAKNGDADIFVSGGDDLAAALPDDAIDAQEVERLRRIFFEACGRTMSIGVGFSASEAIHNLRRAKLMGKNAVVSPTQIATLADVEA